MFFYTIVLFSIDMYSPVNKFYINFIIISILINVVILLLNCLVLIQCASSLHTFSFS